ncbi:MAG: hypothetical protein LBG05_09605 [Treponema sp.]|nr:hypothetical protein [Treponema sp.]
MISRFCLPTAAMLPATTYLAPTCFPMAAIVSGSVIPPPIWKPCSPRMAALMLVRGTGVNTAVRSRSNENSSAMVSPSSPCPPVNGRMARLSFANAPPPATERAHRARNTYFFIEISLCLSGFHYHQFPSLMQAAGIPPLNMPTEGVEYVHYIRYFPFCICTNS